MEQIIFRWNEGKGQQLAYLLCVMLVFVGIQRLFFQDFLCLERLTRLMYIKVLLMWFLSGHDNAYSSDHSFHLRRQKIRIHSPESLPTRLLSLSLTVFYNFHALMWSHFIGLYPKQFKTTLILKKGENCFKYMIIFYYKNRCHHSVLKQINRPLEVLQLFMLPIIAST